MHRIDSGLFALGLLAAFLGTAQAQSFDQALTGGSPIIGLRARYEDVTDASKAVDAEAQTLRARIGYEAGSWNGLQLTAEFDQIWALGGTPYNSTCNGKNRLPTDRRSQHDGPQPITTGLYLRLSHQIRIGPPAPANRQSAIRR